MKIIILLAFFLSASIFFAALYLIPKSNFQIWPAAHLKLKSFVSKKEKLSQKLERAKIAVEVYLLLHILAVSASVITVLSRMGSSLTLTQAVTPLYILLAPLYLILLTRNNKYKKEALVDVEEVQRITHFLERTGAAPKNINHYLAQTIKGPLSPYMKRVAASSILSIDIKDEYQLLKMNFKDLREVCNFANISIQKQMTGKSDLLYEQQLDQIKQVKMTRYKMKRTQNRIWLTLLAFVLLMSFLSVTLYPMSNAFMNDLIKNMSN